MSRIVLLILVFLIPTVVGATEQVSPQKIRLAKAYENLVVVDLSPLGHQKADGCTRGDDRFIGFSLDSGEGKAMYAAVLSARVADKDIGFGVDGCIDWGPTSIPKVYRVDF